MLKHIKIISHLIKWNSDLKAKATVLNKPVSAPSPTSYYLYFTLFSLVSIFSMITYYDYTL